MWNYAGYWARKRVVRFGAGLAHPLRTSKATAAVLFWQDARIVKDCKVYPYEVAEGPANMALDEVLLEAVGAGELPAVLRLYGWSVPTLSLGYFQRVSEIREQPRFRAVPLVRRPTGGGAIWHHHEVTYALVVPESHSFSRPSTQLYRAVHTAISDGLVGLGIGAVRQGEVFSPADCERSRPLLCFTDRSPEDILFDGNKIVGRRSVVPGGCPPTWVRFAVSIVGDARATRTVRCRESFGRSDTLVREAGEVDHGGPQPEWSGRNNSRRDSRAGERARIQPLPRVRVDGNSVSRSLRVRVTPFNLRKIKLQ